MFFFYKDEHLMIEAIDLGKEDFHKLKFGKFFVRS